MTLSFSHAAGIYLDTLLAHSLATTLDSECHAKSKCHLKDPTLDVRSCFWMEVPVEVKSGERLCFLLWDDTERVSKRLSSLRRRQFVRS